MEKKNRYWLGHFTKLWYLEHTYAHLIAEINNLITFPKQVKALPQVDYFVPSTEYYTLDRNGKSSLRC